VLFSLIPIFINLRTNKTYLKGNSSSINGLTITGYLPYIKLVLFPAYVFTAAAITILSHLIAGANH
jgi:hypothetical protein